MDVRSVGNSAVLKETCLIEAFNLKAAIEFDMRGSEPAKVTSDTNAAKEAMTDMPPRREDELDAVTLHNQVTCPVLCSIGNTHCIHSLSHDTT